MDNIIEGYPSLVEYYNNNSDNRNYSDSIVLIKNTNNINGFVKGGGNILLN